MHNPTPTLGAFVNKREGHRIAGVILTAGSTTADVFLADGSILRAVKMAGAAVTGESVEVEFVAGQEPVVYSAKADTSAAGVVVIGSSGAGGGGIAGTEPATIGSWTGNTILGTQHTHAVDTTIARSAITLSTVGLGLTGGGDLTANRTFTLTSSSNPGNTESILATSNTGLLTLNKLKIGDDENDNAYIRFADHTDSNRGYGLFSYFRSMWLGYDSGSGFLGGVHPSDWKHRFNEFGDAVHSKMALRRDASGLTGSNPLDPPLYSLDVFSASDQMVRMTNTSGDGAATMRLSADGNLELATSGDVIFDPVGNELLPRTNYDLNIGALSKKYLSLHAAELWVETLVAQDTVATIGGRIIVAPTTQLTRDLPGASGNYETIDFVASSTSSANGTSSNNISQVGAVTTATSAGGGSITAPTFVSKASSTGLSNSIVVNKPTGTVNGNVMLAWVVWYNQPTIAAPSGWTKIGSTQSWTADGATARLACYFKVASGEGSSYTWSLSGGFTDTWGGLIHTYSGVDTLNPIDASGSITDNGSSTSMTASSITTASSETRVVFFGAALSLDSDSVTITPPSGMTERDETDGGADSWIQMYSADEVKSSPGATGSKSATMSSAENNGAVLIALKPATASSNTSITIDKPAGAGVGHVAIAAIAVGSTSSLITEPPGWTIFSNPAGDNGRFLYYYKVLGSSEPDSYTWTLNTSNSMAGAIGVYSNVDTSNPINASGHQINNTASTSLTVPSISTTVADTHLVLVGAVLDATAGTTSGTAPGGYTEEADTGAGNVRIYFADKAQPLAGATGAQSVLLSASKKSVGAHIALKPVSGSNSSLSAPKPAGTVDGHFMLAYVSTPFGATTSAPSGWTLIHSDYTSSNDFKVYYKAALGEPTSYNWAINQPGDLLVHILTFSNVDTYNPISAHTIQDQIGTTPTAAGLTPATQKDMLVFGTAFYAVGGGSFTVSPPSDMVERTEAGLVDTKIETATQLLTSGAPVPNKSAALSASAQWVASLISLRPVSSGVANTIYVKHNQMRPGDVVLMQSSGKLEYMSITSFPTTITQGAEYSYLVARNIDGTGENDWFAGDAVVNTGTVGSGHIDLYSLESINGRTPDYIFNFYADNSTYSANYANETTWNMWARPNSTGMAVNSAVYYGVKSSPWSNLFHHIVSPFTGSGLAVVLEYFNGSSWAAVQGASGAGTLNTTQVGPGALSFFWNSASQTGWTMNNVNGVSAFWIRMRITALSSVSSPAVNGQRRVYIQKNQWGPTIVGWKRDGLAFNAISEHWAIGNLNGLYGYGTDVMGFAAGRYTQAWISADEVNGFRINKEGTTLAKFSNTGFFIGSETGKRIQYTASTGELDIVSSATDNLITNPDFENGTSGWAVIEGGGDFFISSTTKRSGSYCAVIGNAGQNIAVGFRAIPVSPQETYTVRMYISGRISTASSGGLYIRMQERNAYPPTGEYVRASNRTSFTDLLNNGPVPNNSTWVLHEYVYTVPANIYWVTLSVYSIAGGGSQGFFLEDVEFIRQRQSVHIANGAITALKISADAIDGKTITGATIRTSATNPRIELNSSWLRGFGADGVTEFEALVSGADAGRISAGAGKVLIGRNGITIKSTTGYSESAAVNFYDSGTTNAASLYMVYGASTNQLWLYSFPPAGKSSTVSLYAQSSSPAAAQSRLLASNGTSTVSVVADASNGVSLNGGTRVGSVSIAPAEGELRVPNYASHFLPFCAYQSLSHNISTNTNPFMVTIRQNGTIKSWAQSMFVDSSNSGNNATHYWVISIVRLNDLATIASFTTSDIGTNTWARKVYTSLNLSITTANIAVFIQVAKVNNPGALSLGGPEVWFE